MDPLNVEVSIRLEDELLELCHLRRRSSIGERGFKGYELTAFRECDQTRWDSSQPEWQHQHSRTPVATTGAAVPVGRGPPAVLHASNNLNVMDISRVLPYNSQSGVVPSQHHACCAPSGDRCRWS